MNQQESMSVAGTVLGYALAAASTALVTRGIMTSDQASALMPELSAVILGIGAIAIGWWKKNQHSPAAIADAIATTPAVASAAVAAVNSPAVEGVKVVSDMSASPQVNLSPTGVVTPAPTISKP